MKKNNSKITFARLVVSLISTKVAIIIIIALQLYYTHDKFKK